MTEQSAGRPFPALQDVPGGRTLIGDPAAVKIAAIAARDVPGVYSLGAGSGRALGAIRDAVGANDLIHGVKVEVGQTQLAVDISLVAEYGYALNALADAVRVAVYEALTELVGLQVIEVNVEILDVHLPPPAEPRTVERIRTTGSTQLKQPAE
ncbi:Asp23/Gls24 family envelope stress response protein [Arthrobacter sp. NamB2]|uniref:Asp23/Gls24 family envelope stress response protein n=1 Tax=Arthrobacter sp. NamB2 TaxID=2576035 RepID=UPI0010C9D410|nr:Asp23/Gls24 family envelope stress response protein [Arthrobacter sp. NamB2]TKV27293.1 Asp23/Gls24 family envelope stress response protein [Arthrobacter sp. NamB2]